jgi:hypothetical protein
MMPLSFRALRLAGKARNRCRHRKAAKPRLSDPHHLFPDLPVPAPGKGEDSLSKGDPLTTLNKLFLVHLTGRALHTPWRNSLFVMKGTGDRNQEITHLPSGRIVIGLRESPLASGESNGVSQIRCQ